MEESIPEKSCPGERSSESQQFANRPNDRVKEARPDEKGALIAVCGMKGSGKSAFIRQLAGGPGKASHGLYSETYGVEEFSFMLGDRSVTLIDTPGFDDSELSENKVLSTLADLLDASGTRLSGIIYLHDVTIVRAASLSKPNLALWRKLCGVAGLSSVLIVGTRWDLFNKKLAIQRQQQLESDGSFWAALLACGAQSHRYHGAREEAEALIEILLKKPQVTSTLKQGRSNESKTLIETDSVAFLREEIVRLEQQHRQDMAALREEMGLQRDQMFGMIRKLQQSNEQLRDQINRLQRGQQGSPRLGESSRSPNEKGVLKAGPGRDQAETKRAERERLEREQKERLQENRRQRVAERTAQEQRLRERREEEQKRKTQREKEQLKEEERKKREREREQHEQELNEWEDNFQRWQELQKQWESSNQ